MKNWIGLGIGAAMIVAAFFIAGLGSDAAPQPQSARVFATALHETPTRAPTPIPTMTPILSGTLFRAAGVALRLPQTYDSALVMQSEDSTDQSKNFSLHIRLNATYIVDLENGLPRGTESIRIIKVGSWLPSLRVPDAVLGSDWTASAADGPQVVSLGRYQAFRIVIQGLKVSDRPVTKLLYWIKQSDAYWLVMFTAPADEFEQSLPAFEESMRTFSVMP